MRFRQLLLLKHSGLTLRKDWQPEDTIQSMQPLADSLAKAMPQHSMWDAQLVQDLHQLHTLNITHIE